MVEPAIKTYAELKKLSIPDAATFLLRKLIRIYPMVKSAGGLNKGNLLGPNDPYALAADFPRSENYPVREYLLGAPWTMLVNFGCVVDPSGTGFYSITDQGFAMVEKAPEIPAPEAFSATSNTPTGDAPTVFISYSWDSERLKEWVLQFATRLQEKGGVKVILDRWHLRPGMDRTHFMESNIEASDFVLVVCTPDYAAKSNARSGGVGYEAMIITTQLAHQVLQSKFIPVLRAGKWGPTSQPTWIDSKIGVNLSGDPYDENQYEDLLRELHRSPVQPPPIGPKPVFSDRRQPQGAGRTDALEPTTQSSSASPEAPTSNKSDRGLPQEYLSPEDFELNFADHTSEGIDERVGGMLISIGNRRIMNLNNFRVFVREARSFDSKHSRFREGYGFKPVPLLSAATLLAGDNTKRAWCVRVNDHHLEVGSDINSGILRWPQGDKSQQEIWLLTLSIEADGYQPWTFDMSVSWSPDSDRPDLRSVWEHGYVAEA